MHYSSLILILLFAWAALADSDASWPALNLAAPDQVQLGEPVDAQLKRGIARLAQEPYTPEWLLADVSFKVDRIFTNYSGDVSGRFLELASVTSPPGQCQPSSLGPVVKEIAQYQKGDGHFGLPIELSQKMEKNSAPIPMLWGNARLLVGLVAAASHFHDTNLLAAARRLGDFYVTTAGVFCSPAREAELKATGTYGDGYTCCYFPAIEGLALLYRATGERRYLQQAERMAEWFKGFDALPTDHSHGNLCAWRGILALYDITGRREYLERAVGKWEKAMREGYVWPVGGVGEHWYINYPGDEGCSESDWLRFNLELWRYTGGTRFLEIAERLLHNQYAGNQCNNGGYGWRAFDGDAAGPIGTHGNVQEWNFCCSFHGPLGLHFLKAYLAAGSERGVYVSFPLDFQAKVRSGRLDWQVGLKSRPAGSEPLREFDLGLAPLGKKFARTTLWLRNPGWAAKVRLADSSGAPVPFTVQNGYLRVTRTFKSGERLRVSFEAALRVEGRRFQQSTLAFGEISRLHDVALLDGPDLLFAAPAPGSGRLTLLAQQEASGHLRLPQTPEGAYVSVVLANADAGTEAITAALRSAKPVRLQPEFRLRTHRRAAFMHDLIVVPTALLPAQALQDFVTRAGTTLAATAAPFFGEHLEQRSELWAPTANWQFTPRGLLVNGGSVGLLDSEGYGDCRFEFDLELPREGQGISGWVVRATSESEHLMFQLQSADTTLDAPQFKTRPNTLRPHVCHWGQWTLGETVPLPKQILRGETHHIAVECRGPRTTVFLDGEKIFQTENPEYQTGTVGFHASNEGEQGLFRNVSLKPL
jgi:hypothetical protein